MTAGGVALSFASVHLDKRVSYKWVRAVGWLWAGGAEGARLRALTDTRLGG